MENTQSTSLRLAKQNFLIGPSWERVGMATERTERGLMFRVSLFRAAAATVSCSIWNDSKVQSLVGVGRCAIYANNPASERDNEFFSYQLARKSGYECENVSGGPGNKDEDKETGLSIGCCANGSVEQRSYARYNRVRFYARSHVGSTWMY